MRDCPKSNEHFELELPRLGAVSRLDNSTSTKMRQYHFPDLLFLIEIKNSRNVLVDLKVWLGYEHVFTINPVGFSVGLVRKM